MCAAGFFVLFEGAEAAEVGAAAEEAAAAVESAEDEAPAAAAAAALARLPACAAFFCLSNSSFCKASDTIRSGEKIELCVLRAARIPLLSRSPYSPPIWF